MKRSFFFHYNKPASRQRGKPVISIHYKDRCLLVDNIVCSVETKGRINKRQPFFVIAGKASDISIKDNIAYVS